jgi:hypothetical protein
VGFVAPGREALQSFDSHFLTVAQRTEILGLAQGTRFREKIRLFAPVFLVLFRYLSVSFTESGTTTLKPTLEIGFC